jgi:glutamyl-tRNA synthetase
MSTRVRFAPSPTGYLHVGNIRIAVFNYLFAKKNNGKFILRIDDTDLERSTKEFEDLIFEDLEWLGIEWSELYRQSDRLEKYNSAFELLKNRGRVYACYETKEELSLKRKIQASKGKPPIYDRASLALTSRQTSDFESSGIKPYWRFKLNDTGCAEWIDLVHEKIHIPLNSISDPILIKPDGSFVYTFASVIDDVDFGITHVIRGDDHTTNTAAQIDIFKAYSETVPHFAHIPLLSSIDGHDISKRTGSQLSILNMRNDGLEPRAILNVLANLGTSNNAVYRDTIGDLIEKFSFDQMSLSSPKFNIGEVKVFTQRIISEKTFNEVKSELENLGLQNISEEFWYTIRENLHSISESIFWHDILFNGIKVIKENENFVNQMLETLKNPIDFNEWIADLKKISSKNGRELFHPMRIILTGLKHGPKLEKIVNLLGYERVKNRLKQNLQAT